MSKRKEEEKKREKRKMNIRGHCGSFALQEYKDLTVDLYHPLSC